jgi:hypothetical protein
MGEKGEGLPGTTGFLLQHGSHVRVRGIHGEGQDSRGYGMMEWDSRSQKGFGSVKGRVHGRGPLKRMLGGTGISERTENMSNGRKKSEIEV